MQVKDLTWNNEIENILKNNKIKCTKYALLYKKDSEKYYRYHNYLFFTNSVITSITSMSIITSNSLFTTINPDTINIINIIFGGLIVFSTALSSFQHITNYNDLSNQHKNASIKYKCLAANMSILLSLDDTKKMNSIESFAQVNDEFTTLENNSPIISDFLGDTENEIETPKVIEPPKVIETPKVIEVPKETTTTTIEMGFVLPKNSMTEFTAQRWALNYSDDK